MKQNGIFLIILIIFFGMVCSCDNKPKKTKKISLLELYDSLKRTKAKEESQSKVDNKISMKIISPKRKSLRNGEKFWYAGTYYDITFDEDQYITFSDKDTENGILFFSNGCIGRSIAIIDANGKYSFSNNCPAKWIQEISRTHSSEAYETCINGDNWIILYFEDSFKQKGCPRDLLECLLEHEALHVSFNEKENWIVLTSEGEIYGDKESMEFVKRAKKTLPEADLRYFSVVGNSYYASSFNGIYFENIPSYLAKEIQKIDFASVKMSFNTNGEFFITQNGQDYFTACLTKKHFRELKNNLSAFEVKKVKNTNNSSSSNSSSTSPSVPNIPHYCAICNGNRKCTSCVNGRYYAHDRYHECGVCNGTGICSYCNGTGLQP